MSEEKGKTKEKSTFSFWNFFKRDKKKKEKGKKTLEKQVSKDDLALLNRKSSKDSSTFSKAIVITDYEANHSRELNLIKGEIIFVEKMDLETRRAFGSTASRNGEGWFPLNCVQIQTSFKKSNEEKTVVQGGTKQDTKEARSNEKKPTKKIGKYNTFDIEKLKEQFNDYPDINESKHSVASENTVGSSSSYEEFNGKDSMYVARAKKNSTTTKENDEEDEETSNHEDGKPSFVVPKESIKPNTGKYPGTYSKKRRPQRSMSENDEKEEKVVLHVPPPLDAKPKKGILKKPKVIIEDQAQEEKKEENIQTKTKTNLTNTKQEIEENKSEPKESSLKQTINEEPKKAEEIKEKEPKEEIKKEKEEEENKTSKKEDFNIEKKDKTEINEEKKEKKLIQKDNESSSDESQEEEKEAEEEEKSDNNETQLKKKLSREEKFHSTKK